MLRLKPVSLREANEYVKQQHRHHKPVVGHTKQPTNTHQEVTENE